MVALALTTGCDDGGGTDTADAASDATGFGGNADGGVGGVGGDGEGGVGGDGEGGVGGDGEGGEGGVGGQGGEGEGGMGGGMGGVGGDGEGGMGGVGGVGGDGEGGMGGDIGGAGGDGPCGEAGETRDCGDCPGSTQTCDGDIWGPCVAPDEICDGADNNCDGQTDEGFADLGEACSAGEGACAADGQIVCNPAGDGTVCDAEPGMPGEEICNGVDDNCDGQIDDSLGGMDCSVGVGACVSAGQTACIDGEMICNAQPGEPQPEQCNGVDDNCDGEVDEGLGGMACAAGEGACQAEGQTACVDGEMVCDAQPGMPQPEVCNGIDDNCDGAVDEDLGGMPCEVGVGACAAQGVTACVDGAPTCEGEPGEGGPEQCNGIDDDCNGEVDDNIAAVPCEAGVGECLAQGETACVDGATVCGAEPGEPGVEVCDGNDTDCDGEIDNIDPEPCYEGPEGTAGVGACREGTTACGKGVFCQGQVVPGDEICDEIDNDCDGETDEGDVCVREECERACANLVECGQVPPEEEAGCVIGCGAKAPPEVRRCVADAQDCEEVLVCVNGPVACGDGEVNQEGEQCDDGNNDNGDGCDENCQIEPVCGDGVVNQESEQCDDGNNDNGDGCDAECQEEPIEIRGNFMLCGNAQRDVAGFVQPRDGLEFLLGCEPNDATVTLLISRSGNPDGAVLQAFLARGGNIITEFIHTDDIWNRVFPNEPVEQGVRNGLCADNINPVVRYNEDDPFWIDNGDLPLQDPTNTGCGYDVSAYPGIVPLGGPEEGIVTLAYRDVGDGRFWLVDRDWQDNQQGADIWNAASQQLMRYMIIFQGVRDGDVRLVGGESANRGRVEIFLNDAWGTVCDDAWGLPDADVTCRQLGYRGAVQAIQRFGGGVDPIWLDNVNCAGDEERLVDCPANAIGNHNCVHAEDAGVECLVGDGVEGDNCANDGHCLGDLVCLDGVCSPALFCGDGIVNGNESCDDGNLEPGDGCDANCQIEPPPDRVILMHCGNSGRPVGSFLNPDDGLEVVAGCVPDDTVQALLVPRGGVGQFVANADAIRAYVEGGGIVITEFNISDEVYNALFGAQVAQPGNRSGNCGDNINPPTRLNLEDPFWQANGELAPLAARAGCGYDMSGWDAPIVPLGGWDPNSVSLAYQDLGGGRVWLVESDWQDNENVFTEESRLLMRYMILNTGGLSFRGIREDVPVQEVLDGGFEPCFVGPFGAANIALDPVLQACSGDVLMMACRPNGADTYTVAAMGLRDEILQDDGNAREGFHDHNGVSWYYSPSWSWGFFEPGTGVTRNSCDTANEQGERRMCIHTSDNNINGGYRCGVQIGLNNNNDWERVILQRSGNVPPEEPQGDPLGTPGCAADTDCATGVCWDFADYDPLCGGSVCSAECANDQECADQFRAAGAQNPEAATCGQDGRCQPIGSGFGAFFCQ